MQSVSKEYKVYEQQSGLRNTMKNFFHPKIKIVNAVSDLSFQIERGESVGFIGENGAGKSTTIKMMSGILSPTSGEITIKGIKPYEHRKENARNIGVVFGQRNRLMWDLPMNDSFALYKEIYRIDDAVFRQNVERFVEMLKMQDFLQTPIRQLSLGQRMKVEIALSLLHNPEILFLDEPTIGLDVLAKNQIRKFLRETNRLRQTTIILTSHDMKDLDEVCDRIIMIQKGRLFFDGSIQLFKKQFYKESLIEFELEETPDLEEIQEVVPCRVVKVENNIVTLAYDKSVCPVQDIQNGVGRYFHIRNVFFRDADIEDIVRDIYEESSK